ncbi:YciI family protein [Streptomyces sp. NRRL F-5630]|uniref:YciI family protein n=1 Tax=Streptomyces sp. NRRL F-5630 TaxID=1463864 RepID=UPI003EB81779
MSNFIVRLEHPDEAGWKTWVGPHVEWVRARIADGTIIASGPSVGTEIRQGWLIMSAETEQELRETLATDPFWENGIVENLLIVEWDPIFGRLDDISTSPGG